MIATERLSLYRIEDGFKNFITTFLADWDHARYLPLSRPYSPVEAERWLGFRLDHWQDHGFGVFSVMLRDTGETVGYCGVEHVRTTAFIDIRYGISKERWENGYGFEAAKAVVEYGFTTLGLWKLYGAVAAQNTSSIRLLEKLGMTDDPEFHEYGDDILHYSISSARDNA